MYNHWKKILLALTAFFWNACDNNTTPTGPVVGPDPTSSSTEGQNSSSSAVNPGSSSVDNPVSSSVASSSSTPIAESSSDGIEVVPLYGVYMDKETCTTHQGDNVYECTDGVTCEEAATGDLDFVETTSPEVSAKYGVVYKPEVTAKYGVVYIKDKTYKCSDGKVYNEAEFREHYDVITSIPDKKIPCYKDRVDEFVDCEDGNTFSFGTDENGNKTYVGPYAEMTEKEFLDKYEIFEQKVVLYGPPCVFDGTCGEDK